MVGKPRYYFKWVFNGRMGDVVRKQKSRMPKIAITKGWVEKEDRRITYNKTEQ